MFVRYKNLCNRYRHRLQKIYVRSGNETPGNNRQNEGAAVLKYLFQKSIDVFYHWIEPRII